MKKIRNPESEIRKKFKVSESRKAKGGRAASVFHISRNSDLFRVSDFEFRIFSTP